VIGADWPEDQFAQYGSGGAVEDDMVGCGFNDRDALALPVHADADFALAVAAGFDADSGAALLGGGRRRVQPIALVSSYSVDGRGRGSRSADDERRRPVRTAKPA
jgi:hypothetical protein